MCTSTSLHLSKSLHHNLDSEVCPSCDHSSTESTLTGRWNRTYDHSGVIDERSGVRIPIPSECSMQGTDSNYSTWNERTHSSPPLFQHKHWLQIFSVPQHTCATPLAWDGYCRIYRIPALPPQGTGLLLLIKGQGKGGPH